MGEETRTVPLSQSRTEMTEMLLPDSTNALGRALGGVVLHWMDLCVDSIREPSRYAVRGPSVLSYISLVRTDTKR